MKNNQNKSSKRYTTEEIFALLNINNNDNSGNDEIKLQNEKSSWSKNTTDIKNENKSIYKQDSANLLNSTENEQLETELNIFEKEEEQQIIKNDNAITNNENNIDLAYIPNLDEDDTTSNFMNNNSSDDIYEENEDDNILGFIKEENDKYNLDGTNLNKNNEIITNENNSLNNLKNPFIRASIQSEYNNNNFKIGDNDSEIYEQQTPKFFKKKQINYIR